jgi:hypothetical protein
MECGVEGVRVETLSCDSAFIAGQSEVVMNIQSEWPERSQSEGAECSQWEGSKTRDENDFLAKWGHVRARGVVGV